ncbi:delta(3,5)-Delta(2,4)-dienoyl-CoA isomerase, mitochondrial-like, partial [Sorex araneus]|uniref:delta(3,5)-Delta(2,4)-dienoyl-CoA isomerase, mitochondrial-like n=1 Tax=Sorex araneus TaxID=42254 RepID=UPI00243363A3
RATPETGDAVGGCRVPRLLPHVLLSRVPHRPRWRTWPGVRSSARRAHSLAVAESWPLRAPGLSATAATCPAARDAGNRLGSSCEALRSGGASGSTGVDLITACDIRYCAHDAFFQVKEVDVGLAADVGTLQRLPKIVGNQSLVNELAFTSRKMMADEALGCGLVSRVFPDRETMLDAAFALAAEIASKSPVAVQGTKVNLIYSRDHSVSEGLNYMSSWNMAMLQTDDIMKSVQAAMEKRDLKSVTFSKL